MDKLHHDRMMHDHLGWPEPRRKDDSCQLYPGYDYVYTLKEIDLPGEGYDTIEVVIADDAPDGIEFVGAISNNVIHLTIKCMCQDATMTDVETKFSVYAIGTDAITEDNDPIEYRDMVTKGTLRIQAGLI